MRLWSLHPRYLDWKGLGAEWREGLLAQKVLQGMTKGWRNHPQLDRFKGHGNPVSAIGFYLLKVHEEAERRGYNYNFSKVVRQVDDIERVELTDGQLMYEYELLSERLERRDPEKLRENQNLFRGSPPVPHPLFVAVKGNVEHWETGYWNTQPDDSL